MQNSASGVPIDADRGGVGRVEDRVVPRDVPSHELDRQPRPQHDVDGVRIDPHVELGDRVRVADVIGDGTHHDAAGDPLGQRGIALERHGDVGERAERDQRERPGVLVRRRQQGVDGVDPGRLAPGQVEPDVAHAVDTVDVLGGLERELQRRGLPDVDRHRRAAQLDGVQRVLHRLRQRHVAGDDADADDVDVGVAECHHQRHGVVAGGVGVDEEWPWHRRSVRSARG